jgi:hypothetical protein
MSGYGSDAGNPNYVESVGSLKKKTKEDLRIDQLIPEEILTDSGDNGIKQLLEKYYEFMNMKEFIYVETDTFTDLIASDRAVFRVLDPNDDNNEFFTDFDGASSSLVVTNIDKTETIIPLSGTNVQISNGNELPGTLKDRTTEIGKTFSVSLPKPTEAGYVNHNGKTAKLVTPMTYWVGPGPSYVINAIEEAMNIDENTEDYLELMQKEIAQAIPRTLTVNKRNLYKNINDFYKLKGTSDSIEVFFRLLFNESVETEFPYDKTLIPSSGKWDAGLNRYLDHKGFLSDNIKLQDSKFYQKFSYVVRTGKNLSDWETAFDKLVHPAGFVFFGEILILTQLTRAALGDNIRQDLVELDIGIGEGSTGSIPVPNQPGFVYTYKDLYGRLNRKTLSSMPGVQPGVIGAEDVALLVEAFSSFFLPNAEGRISKSGQLSLTLNANGSITNVSVANPGFGYPIDQATKTIVNGQEFFDGPDITVTGDPIEGQGIGTALLTCKVDVDGRIDNVTIVSAGSNYASANASPDANSNNGKLTTIIKSGSEKHFATAPSIIVSPPTATDADGVLLSSNVNATATVQISPSDVYYTAQEETNDLALEEGLRVGAVEGEIKIRQGDILGFTITNQGNGYVVDPIVRFDSPTHSEERAKEVKEILILSLNHVATEVGDENFRTLINNNYFNRKGSNFDSHRMFRNGYPISFLSANTIESFPGTVINRYNNKAIIAQE